jgi:hypothetical protein
VHHIVRHAQMRAEQVMGKNPDNADNQKNQAEKFTHSLCHLFDPPVERLGNARNLSFRMKGSKSNLRGVRGKRADCTPNLFRARKVFP